MKLGVTVNPASGRISPVFESAQTLLIVQCCRRTLTVERQIALPPELAQKADVLLGHELCHVISGAMANETLEYLKLRGVPVVPFAAGDWRQVAEAFVAARRHLNVKHILPGCRRHFKQCCKNQPSEETIS